MDQKGKNGPKGQKMDQNNQNELNGPKWTKRCANIVEFNCLNTN